MKQLIVLEGTDGVGKSTQTKLLYDHFKAQDKKVRLVVQPNPLNIIGFLRTAIKQNPSFTSLERQLLAACSHAVDAYTMFSPTPHDPVAPDIVIMDRCYLSGLVYGPLSGVSKEHVQLLDTILSNIYHSAARSWGDVHVDVLFLKAPKRLDKADSDVFESKISWCDLVTAYHALWLELVSGNRTVFVSWEKHAIIHVNRNDKIKIVHQLLVSKVDHAF